MPAHHKQRIPGGHGGMVTRPPARCPGSAQKLGCPAFAHVLPNHAATRAIPRYCGEPDQPLLSQPTAGSTGRCTGRC